jgi:ATP-dependent DNA helicase RecQ
VNWAEKPGIVYVATRKHAETIMHALCEHGVKASFYHAGLKPSERMDVQDQFMNGEAEVIVATNAFGMGIDKANVRFVYHYDISDSLDSYYQEIGRAGRDGEPSEAVLFFRRQDLGVRRFLSGEGKLATEEYEKVADVIADQEGPVEPEEIGDEVDMSKRKLTTVIQRLEDAGALEVLPTGEVEVVENFDTEAAARKAAEEQERRKESKQERLRLMEDYAETSQCRREYLICYFGQNYSGPCGNCDNCHSAAAPETGDIEVDPTVGTRREVA